MIMVDLLISGAGISGLIAGIRAQQLGLHSCIIEKQKHFVETLKGEYIQPTGLRTLQKMGIAADVERHGIAVQTISHHFWPLIPFKNPRALDFHYPRGEGFPDRAIAMPHLDLKNVLLKIYLRLGGEIKMDSLIENIEHPVGNDIIAAIKTGESRTKIVAKHLVISEGTLSSLAKKTHQKTFGSEQASSYMIGGISTQDFVPMGQFITAQSKEGLICTFKINERTSRVYFYKDLTGENKNPFKNRRPDSFLRDAVRTSAIAPMFRAAEFDNRVMAAPYIPKYSKSPSLGSITLTGDSAGASHPLGGYGMSSAAADGYQIAELLKEYKDGSISLTELNKKFNEARLKRYLTSKFVSEVLSQIFGGTSKRARSMRRVALRNWESNSYARYFSGKVFGGMLTDPMTLNDFLSVWGISLDFSKLPLTSDLPKIIYKSKDLTTRKIISGIIRSSQIFF